MEKVCELEGKSVYGRMGRKDFFWGGVIVWGWDVLIVRIFTELGAEFSAEFFGKWLF